MEPGSSPAQEPVDTSVVDSAPQVETQAPQGAADAPQTTDQSPGSEKTQDGKPATALEAVSAALEGKKPAADSSTAGGETDPAQKPADTQVEDQDKNLPFNNHPRWKQVHGRMKQLEAELPVLSEKAGHWEALQDKFRQTGLDPADVEPLFEGGARLRSVGTTTEEIGQLMAVGAALKLADRQVVMQIAGPVFEALGLGLHEILPEDIRSQVDEGAISEEAAKRMVAAERRAQAEANRRSLLERAESERGQHQRVAETRNAQAQAVAGWEQRIQSTDTDYARKQPFVIEQITMLRDLYKPGTPDQAVRICEMALENVNRIMGTARPQARRPEIRPVVGGNTHTARPVPKTPLEAVSQALEKTG